jgi:hypothetical protein
MSDEMDMNVSAGDMPAEETEETTPAMEEASEEATPAMEDEAAA